MDRETQLLSQFQDNGRSVLISLSEIGDLETSEELSGVIEFLQSVSPEGRPVHKRNLQLEVIGGRWPHLVPLVWTLRREAVGVYTFGIIGQSLVDAGGYAQRDMLLKDVPGSQPLIDLLEYLSETKKVLYRTGTPRLPHQLEVVRLEAIVVPIVDNEGLVVSFLNFTRYFWKTVPKGWYR